LARQSHSHYQQFENTTVLREYRFRRAEWQGLLFLI
jgi:hypothetical protein